MSSDAPAGAIGLTRLFHKNVEANAEHWLDMVSIDPDNRYVGGLLNHLRMVHTKELKGLAALGLFFSALFLTEGIGLTEEKPGHPHHADVVQERRDDRLNSLAA